jgi:hypothetical protein
LHLPLFSKYTISSKKTIFSIKNTRTPWFIPCKGRNVARKRICLLTVSAFLVLPALVSPSSASDIDTLYARLYAQFQGPGAASSTITVWLSALKTDGTWPDINYAGTDAVNWPPYDHLDRMMYMATAYRNPAHPLYNSLSLKNCLLAAYDGWMAKNPQSSNWWWNYIGTQNTLGPIMILIKGILSPAQITKGTAILDRSWAYHIFLTADNMISVAEITIWNGCLKNDAATVTNGVNAITTQLVITSAEGIQQDQSFHQHGAQLYSGGYGLNFAYNCSDCAALCRGTAFAFANTKLAILSTFILSGVQPVVRGVSLDHSVMGRGITRPGNSHQQYTVIRICAGMSQAFPSLATQFDAFAGRLAAWPAPPASELSGNFHFWRSDFMTHRRGGFAVSVRMCSNRTVAAELVNNEGLKSCYLGDGAAFCYKSGDEYFDLFPVWNWTRVPGTTCQQQASPPAMPGQYQYGTTNFVGGVSDGTYGATGFDYSRNGVTGRKSWFFFDREIVALGAGITCQSALPVATTANQCRLNGPVTIFTNGARSVLPRGPHALRGVSWIHHDSIGYFFPAGASGADSVMVRNDTQSGAWSDINTSQSTARVTDSVFCCWISHGATPSGAAYAYGMVPAISVDGMQSYAAAPRCRVLANSATLQAVRQDSLRTAGIVFYSADSCKLTDTITVTSDLACIALVRETADSVVLSVSNPLNAAATAHLSLTVQLTGPGAVWNAQQGTTTATFTLPTGMDAGKSVVQAYYRNRAAVAFALPAARREMPVVRCVPGGLLVTHYAAASLIRVYAASGKLISQSPANVKNASGDTFIRLKSSARGVVIVTMVAGGQEWKWVLPIVK